MASTQMLKSWITFCLVVLLCPLTFAGATPDELQKVTHLVVKGYTHLTLLPGKQNTLSTIPDKTNISVNGHTLIINSYSPTKPIVWHGARAVRKISLYGSAHIDASPTKADNIAYIHNHDQASIKINGVARLKEIMQTGGSVLAYWLSSDQLDLTQSGGKLKIAGVTKQLNARMSGSGRADTRHLRSKIAWIHCIGHAQIDAHPLQRMVLFAADSSQTRYYSIPKALSFIKLYDAAVAYVPHQLN